MFRKSFSALALAVAALTSASVQAQTIVFDTSSLSMTLPSVSVAGNLYKLVLVYGADGKLSISSATPVVTVPVGQVSELCTDSNFTIAKFNAITLGMTLDQVSATIGCKNAPYFVARSADFVLYGWASSALQTKTIVVVFDATGSFVKPQDPNQPTNTFKTSTGF